MKNNYLERLFIEELNSEGEVNISGICFFRDEILSSLDPDAYKEVFENWKTERKQGNITRAKQILEFADNSRRFNALKSVFKNHKVIPFIGAGLSIPSDFPSWKDFLYKTQEDSGTDSSIFKRHMDNGEYEEAAQLLDNADPVHLQEQLQNHFGVKPELEEVQGIICRLPEFFQETIITTNYDDLLKIIYEGQEINFHHELFGIDAEEFKALFGAGRRILLKLHGSFISRNKRILTQDDYQRHYSERNILKTCVMESLFSQSLLFLGCSLDKDRTLQCMAEIVEERGNDNLPKHYAFLSCKNLSNDKRTARRKALQKSNIFPIWYDGDHDESIEALLELLNDGES
ncbi:TPA: SIR2 family protein [Neisseria subflava]|jgi:hypothetical protein